MVSHGFDRDRTSTVPKRDLAACKDCHVDISLKDKSATISRACLYGPVEGPTSYPQFCWWSLICHNQWMMGMETGKPVQVGRVGDSVVDIVTDPASGRDHIACYGDGFRRCQKYHDISDLSGIDYFAYRIFLGQLPFYFIG